MLTDLPRNSSYPVDLNPDSLVGGMDGALWERVLHRLSGEVDAQIFAAYLKPLRFSHFDSSLAEVVLLTSSSLVRNHLEKHFQDKILEAYRAEAGSGLEIRVVRFVIGQAEGVTYQNDKRIPYVVVKKVGLANGEAHTGAGSKLFQFHNKGLARQRSGASERRDLFGLNPKYTFGNFIVGNSNQFCHAAAMRVAEQPGKSYNPLFIYGGVGLGKTHILHAIGNAVLDRNPGARVVYMSSETFTNELIQSLRNAKMDEFKSKMRSIEVLLIDDIQFMCGKERTQEEFFHTFNTLYNAKHQIVLTSDKIPQDIPGIEERLQTRFSWGLTADLQAPDFETRVAILRRKAALDNFEVPENVAHYVAESVSSNVRELEGALTRLHAITSLQNLPITLEIAEAALKPLLQPKVISLSINDIKRGVADHFSLKVADIISKRRTKNLSFPRHIAMYLCRKHTTSSYPEIGSQFGGRDHSSVIHAANVVTSKIANDQRVKDIVAEIERRLLSI